MIDIKKCLQELTTEEKISLLEGADMGFTTAIERLGIPRILMVDGPHGVRVVRGTEAAGKKPYTMTGPMNEATALPCEAAMAAAWNTELVELAGKQVGEECQSYGVGVLLGPGADGKRSPLGGRNFEYYSEDPYVSGKMAAAFIRGLQSEGVGACMKHYVLNDQETRRMSVDVHVDERALWEIYLKPFQIAIRDAKPWSIMGSYNKVAGTHVCENKKLLVDILRDRLGFDGAVISDWSAVRDKAASVKNGLNIQMPGPGGKQREVLDALVEGRLDEQELDERVIPVLELVNKVTAHRKKVEIDWEAHHETAIRLAQEGMVLLKNEGNILPLKKESRVAVIGELAEIPAYAGGGSSTLTPRRLDIPLDELRKCADVIYAPGYRGSRTGEELLDEARKAAGDADTAVLFLGSISSEGLDRKNLLLPDSQMRLLEAVSEANPNVVLVVMCGSALEYRGIEKHAKAILHAWIPGEGCGRAVSNLLFGAVNPSGKLSETFPVSLANTPAYQDFPGFKDDVYYREGILVGYRYYDTKEIRPFYPFGYGLSYTSFAYSSLKLSADSVCAGETLRVSVDVTNTGKYAGKETIQVYVSDREAYMFRPVKELKGFKKTELMPGETKTVTIELDADAFAYYVPHLGRFAVESGDFEILVGASAEDIRCRAGVRVSSADDVRMPLTKEDLFQDFLADDRYRKSAQELLEALKLEEGNVFYQLIMGGSLWQFPELLAFFGIEKEKSDHIIDCLLGRKSMNE